MNLVKHENSRKIEHSKISRKKLNFINRLKSAQQKILFWLLSSI